MAEVAKIFVTVGSFVFIKLGAGCTIVFVKYI